MKVYFTALMLVAIAMIIMGCPNESTSSQETVTTPYTITFDKGEGEGSMAKQTNVEHNKATEINLMDGFTAPTIRLFAGWKLEGDSDTYADGDKITITANTTLIAQWKMDEVLVKKGSFLAGDTNNKPTVTLTKNYFMGASEVTQGQYYAVMTDLDDERRRPSSFGKTDDSDAWKSLPVETVDWYDALAFCNALSKLEKLDECYVISKSGGPSGQETNPYYWTATYNKTKNGYRLPTEAEWEYAAKGGQEEGSHTLKYAGTNTESEVKNYAWYKGNGTGKTKEVKTKKPNAIDLYDMSGNVAEWCWDRYGSLTSYPSSTTDPTGGDEPKIRTRVLRACVIRGGGYNTDSYDKNQNGNPAPGNSYDPSGIIITNRVNVTGVSSPDSTVGFRVVRFE